MIYPTPFISINIFNISGLGWVRFGCSFPAASQDELGRSRGGS